MTSVPSQRQTPVQVQTVSQVTTRIRALIEESFTDLAVVGEISNFKGHNSGHWYFSMKDRHATLPCAFFRAENSQIKFELQDGLKVVAHGRLNVYPPKGSYQLIITRMEPVGIGQWQLAFEQLKEKLGNEGLLDQSRKRSIPRMPGKIGIVTSSDGAALRDILTALKRRNPNVQIVVAPTRVQGEASNHDIAQALRDIQKVPDIDVVLIARGGGSLEDLWAFNTEVVARAVASCKIPTISGIGHETDITICDLVADLRAPTPTAAAELVSRKHLEFVERWFNLNRFLAHHMEQRISHGKRSLERLNPRRSLSRQEERLNKMRVFLRSRSERISSRLAHIINDRQHKWHRNHEKLLALSPLNILTRGFAIVRKPDGQIVYDYNQVQPGDKLEALLKNGKLKLTVESIDENW